MGIAFLLIILVIVIVLVVLRRDFKWAIYVISTSEVFFRLMHYIGDNLGVPEVNSLVNKYLPESLFSVIGTYTNGLIYIILCWCLVIIFIWFFIYLVRYIIRSK